MSDGIGLRRLQHSSMVSDVERSVRFYCDLLGFEVRSSIRTPPSSKIPGLTRRPHLGLFEQAGRDGPTSAWPACTTRLGSRGRSPTRPRAAEAPSSGLPRGQSDHGVSLSLYAKDPDGIEFEMFWTVPGGVPVGTRALTSTPRWPAGHRAASEQSHTQGKETGMLAIWVKVRIKPGSGSAFQGHRVDALGSERDEPGCLRFNVLQDAKERTSTTSMRSTMDEGRPRGPSDHAALCVWRGVADVLDGPTEPVRCNHRLSRGARLLGQAVAMGKVVLCRRHVARALPDYYAQERRPPQARHGRGAHRGGV